MAAAAAPPQSLEPAVRPAAWLDEEDGAPQAIVVSPAGEGGPHPVAVMLHGMCSAPQYECGAFADLTDASWLVCPRAATPCPGTDGASWPWPFDTSHASIDAAVGRVAASHPDEVEPTNGALIGFSLGALAALDLAQHGDGRWRALVLVGAEVYPDASQLAQAGVARVVMAAGEADMMHDHMQRAAYALDAQGIPTLFVSLGDVGHAYPPDFSARMADAMAWVVADDVID
jgi:predicted esterase